MLIEIWEVIREESTYMEGKTMPKERSTPQPQHKSPGNNSKDEFSSKEWLCQSIEQDKFYSIKALAKLFMLSEDFWRKRLRDSSVNGLKIKGAVRIPGREVRRFVKEYHHSTGGEMTKIVARG